jgi:nitroreductase
VSTTLPLQAQRVKALRRAAVHATLAPSVHNTQPWRFVIGYDTLEI